MADMPTIYPMRFPSVAAPRAPQSIDDLLPSTYMGQPTPFTSQMQNVGKMLQAKQTDADEANTAALKFGPTVAPGQIAALNDFLFKRGAQPYGGVMDPQNPGATLQVPGGATATPFNTAGQIGDQSSAQIAAATAAKENIAKANQAMTMQKLQQQQDQFVQRTKDRAAALLQAKTIHDQNDLRTRQLTGQKIAMSAQKQQTLGLAMGYHRGASQAYGNANKTQSLIVQKEKEMSTDFTMTPEVKEQKLQEIQVLQDQAASEAQRGQLLDSQATELLNGFGSGIPGVTHPPTVPTPVAPVAPVAPAPAAPVVRANGSRWFDASQLVAHPAAKSQIPAGKTGGWFKPDGTLDTY